MNVLGYSIGKNSLALAAFALVTAGLLALTFANTKDKIKAQEKLAAEKALFEIVPRETHSNNMLETTWDIPQPLLEELSLKEAAQVNVAAKDGELVALIFPSVAVDGYSGDIKLLVGIYADGSLAGVRALAHKETPGLGDKIDLNKSSWILGFDGKSLFNPSAELWKVKKDGGEFDQFTGATVTPRAVVRQTKRSLEFFERYKTQIVADTLTQSKQAPSSPEQIDE